MAEREMTQSDRLINQLKNSGRFVFTFKFDDTVLPIDKKRALLKQNFERALDSYFESSPPMVRNENEVERF